MFFGTPSTLSLLAFLGALQHVALGIGKSVVRALDRNGQVADLWGSVVMCKLARITFLKMYSVYEKHIYRFSADFLPKSYEHSP